MKQKIEIHGEKEMAALFFMARRNKRKRCNVKLWKKCIPIPKNREKVQSKNKILSAMQKKL